MVWVLVVPQPHSTRAQIAGDLTAPTFVTAQETF
jgi:hypothetical protein